VTYETFRDMGIAFAIALILIYMLVVWEFGNFLLPAIVMAPIPLTLIGIIPGHWLLGAEFTATSMIGFIALAGIIVRNSILLVDFARHAVAEGQDLMQAMISACQARTRPILITAFALLAGSSVILFDPIFQGMAISLMFGTIVATLLTLLVIPLGCISARSAFEDDGGPDDGAPGAKVSGPVAGAPGHRVMTSPSGGPLTQVLGYLGLYLKSLGMAFLDGVTQILRSLVRFFLRLMGGSGSRPSSAGPEPSPPTPGGDGGGGGAGSRPSSPAEPAAESGQDKAPAESPATRPTPSGVAVPAEQAEPTTPQRKETTGGKKTPPTVADAPPTKADVTAGRAVETEPDHGEDSSASGSGSSNARRRRGIRLT
jgi:hypothetical protein